ncbi:hypothetical protein [Lentilactobacillus kisonensis]|uniref:Uncharacterized protein n=1 Tax=Lentilactobacillus kisonensis DSM 19906 = JCM 15041 TaxID=1423766 RepID=A0A0R1NRM4_9LACO|nr:hypothetical protein [Lentilactobacillus kisonensis]KRL23006.1 hypothetical protein FC98_GL001037 [Lentilactobacillus kisonensis DSM 19906 = JCM 15041]
MKIRKVVATALLTAGFGLGITSTTANAATVPKSIRGTWYQKAYYNHSLTIRTKLFSHNGTVKQGDSKTVVAREGDFHVMTHKSKFRFKGGQYHTIITHTVGVGDAPTFISAHLRINGKRRHVLLQAPQQGHTFYVLTHFKPTKVYHISGDLKW